VYSFDERTNVRFAAARTLSRPDLRELTPGRTLNFFSGYQDIGNPNLERATIWNYDLRYETFPGLSEVVAVGGFYKDFHQPIEKQIVTGGSDRLLQPMNSDHGHNYGVELEARFGLKRLGPKLDRLFLNANGSLIKSSITLKPQTTATTSAVHPLQGQSNYLANIGLGYTPRPGLDATVLVAAVGRRLYALGIQPVTEDIYQQPSFGLDAVINWSPRPNLRLKFAGRNLTKEGATQMQGDRVVETQDGSRTFAVVVAFGS
jgi:outer membrane receptor protein involved in Fe transport